MRTVKYIIASFLLVGIFIYLLTPQIKTVEEYAICEKEDEQFRDQLISNIERISRGEQPLSEFGFTGISYNVQTVSEQEQVLTHIKTLYRYAILENPEVAWWINACDPVKLKTEVVEEETGKSIVLLSIEIPAIKSMVVNGCLDKKQIERANAAISNAMETTSNYKNLVDCEKLIAYAAYICSNTEYDSGKAKAFIRGESNYGTEWQFISVLDKDPETKSVCEAYSKAFKVLCDRTQFSEELSCLCVTGTVSNGTKKEPHMWNILMINGEQYLADLTFMDSGYSSVFLTKPVSVPGGYRSGSLKYTLDKNMQNIMDEFAKNNLQKKAINQN